MDVDLDRPRYRFTAAYRFTPRLQAGIEWNPRAREAGFIGNYIIATETDRQPMINVGTSSDRIGTPPGPHAYYVTFAKGLSSLKAAPYVTINYSEYEKRLNFPFGVNFGISPQWSTLFMHDGRKSHLLLTYKKEDYSVSLMWIWFRHPGVSISWGF